MSRSKPANPLAELKDLKRERLDIAESEVRSMPRKMRLSRSDRFSLGVKPLPVCRERIGGVRHVALLLALLASGCALATARPPSVEVAAVELRGLGLLDQTLGLTLCVSNPNDVALAFRRVTVALEVAGALLAESASEASVRLPPQSSALVPFTVTTTLRSLGPQVLDVLRSGEVEYRLRGRAQLDGALAVTLPFSRSGRLDLLAAGARLLSLRGQLDLLATGTRLLADTVAAAAGDTRCGKVASA